MTIRKKRVAQIPVQVSVNFCSSSSSTWGSWNSEYFAASYGQACIACEYMQNNIVNYVVEYFQSVLVSLVGQTLTAGM